MKATARIVILLLLVAFALGACNPVRNIQSRERMTQLKVVVNTYRKLMRWGHYDQASQYLRAHNEKGIAPDLKDMARYKVTSLTIADQIVSEAEFDAKVTAYFEFYDIDTGIAGTVRDEEFWWFSKEDKRWYLGSPMVNFSDYVR